MNSKPVIGGIVFLTIGVACLIWPNRIQRFVIEIQEKNSIVQKTNPFSNFIRSNSYLVMLRIVGVLAVGCSLVLFFVR